MEVGASAHGCPRAVQGRAGWCGAGRVGGPRTVRSTVLVLPQLPPGQRPDAEVDPGSMCVWAADVRCHSTNHLASLFPILPAPGAWRAPQGWQSPRAPLKALLAALRRLWSSSGPCWQALQELGTWGTWKTHGGCTDFIPLRRQIPVRHGNGDTVSMGWGTQHHRGRGSRENTRRWEMERQRKAVGAWIKEAGQ